MSRDKLRRLITSEAARLIATGRESDLFRARRAASRRICRGWLRPAEVPSDAEIRDEIERCVYLYEGDARFDNLREMRLAALALMRILKPYHPRLLGDVLTGDVRRAGVIRLQAFAVDPGAVGRHLESAGLECELAPVRTSPRGTRVVTIRAATDAFVVAVDCHEIRHLRSAFVRIATGARVPRVNVRQLAALIAGEYPDVQADDPSRGSRSADRFQVYRMLLMPLAEVEQPRHTHPEGDALFHSLQVFEIVRDQQPWDEELLLAALLHDIGKGIDPVQHVDAALAALDGHITDRTAWLIEQHSAARKLLEGTLGARARRRLQRHEDYDSLLILSRADREGRVPGGRAPTLDEALDYVREVARLCG
jgi:hypothetical protein